MTFEVKHMKYGWVYALYKENKPNYNKRLFNNCFYKIKDEYTNYKEILGRILVENEL